MKKIFALLVLYVQAPIALSENRVIYGEDDRRDLFEAGNDDMLVQRAASTAAIFELSAVKVSRTDPSSVRLKTDHYGHSFGLCSDERFFSQPSGPICSGFLAAPDLLVTAGHCVVSQDHCETLAFVFGFGYQSATHNPAEVALEDVYTCKELVSQHFTDTDALDFAIVRLNRPVTGREPLEIRDQGEIAADTPIAIIGHPSGLPTKITSGGKVQRNDPKDSFFVGNVDSYAGSSGSAVFNNLTGQVEGILVRGHTDFRPTEKGCSVSVHCTDDSCNGEEMTKISFVRDFVSRL